MGVVIISGLAYGIDSHAHRGCLDAGGITVAVLGTPIDKIYPRSNLGLSERILECGAIISEYGPHIETKKYHFLDRNRIVAGLADAILIVEASDHSGTLVTADLANKQNKEVFAVPGDITRPMSAGCLRLIRDGAQIYTEFEDILMPLGLTLNTPERRQAYEFSEDERKIIDCIERGIYSIEEIIKASKLSAEKVSQNITLLEVNGLIRSVGSGGWAIV